VLCPFFTTAGLKHLSERLYPGGEQSVLANAHGLQAQLDAMSLLGEKWCLADLERESIYKLQAQVIMTCRNVVALPSVKCWKLTFLSCAGGCLFSDDCSRMRGIRPRASSNPDPKTPHPAQRGESSQPSMVKALAGGWGAGDFKAFPKRLSDMIRTWLRLPIWLVPCPEVKA
jgi:hypothetical protein